MKYYAYEEFLKDMRVIFESVDYQIGKPDAILAIARGGLTMAHFLALRWDLREVYALNAISYVQNKQQDLVIKNVPKIEEGVKRVLIVDEIVDSGKSLEKIVKIMQEQYPQVQFHTAVIFQKPSAIYQADFFIKDPVDWIDFFWERDMFGDA